MNRRRLRNLLDERGYALMTVTIFALVIILAGVGFFAMSSAETRQAHYRQNSTEAFYLADAAIERARAKFLEDRTWTDGWTDIEEGRGRYSLTVEHVPWPEDTSLPTTARLFATGVVRNATRQIEVYAQVPPVAWGLTMLVCEDVDVGGNLCLGGTVHVNGSADFGPHDSHLACDETYTDGYVITPPPVFTEPAYYPGTTYYYARIEDVDDAAAGVQLGVRAYDRFFVPVPGQVDFLEDLMGPSPNHYPAGYMVSFDSDANLERAFRESGGIFHLNTAAGDSGVVVNFGIQSTLNPAYLTYLDLDGGSMFTVRATIINTRYTSGDRTDSDSWVGGWTFVKQITFEPRLGVGLICHNFEKVGGSQVQMGTTAWPCLVYATGDVASYDLSAGLNSNFDLIGSVVVLGTWVSTGGPDITYNGGFVAHLPIYLNVGWGVGGSGALKILNWREVAAGV